MINDTPLSVATQMMPSGGVVPTRTDSAGLTFVIPISAAGDPGAEHAWKWASKDAAGNVDIVFGITFTNDGDGNVDSISFAMNGNLTINGTSHSISGAIVFGGEITFLQDVFFTDPVSFSEGFHVTSGAVIFDNGVTCNADFSQTSGYHDIQTRPRFSWTTTASANDMELGLSLFHKITGATTINRISKSGYLPGSLAYLRFDSNPSITNAAVASGDLIGIKLNGGSFSPTANDNLVLMLNEDGTFWEEISRSLIT